MTTDINKAIDNSKLKALLSEYNKTQTPEEHNRLLNCIAEELVMNASFLSVVRLSAPPIKNADGTTSIPKNTSMGFPMLTTTDKKNFFPAFVDHEELNKWEEFKDKKPVTFVMNFDRYASMVLDSKQGEGIVINPFSEKLVLDKNTLEKWRIRKIAILNGKN